MNTMAEKRDRIADLQEGMQRIAASDQAIVRVTRKASIGPDALDALLALPREMFPMTDQDGIYWKNQREVRIARWSLLPKKDRPAFLQDAHERTGLWTKMALAKDEKKGKRLNVNVYNTQVIQIPAPSAAAIPEQQVKRMARDERGQLKAIDVEVVKP
jgi:hypothetical protein